jgi:hypothetical protein
MANSDYSDRFVGGKGPAAALYYQFVPPQATLSALGLGDLIRKD